MKEEKKLTKAEALEPFHLAYRAMEQLSRETEEKIKTYQYAHEELQKSMQVTKAFLTDSADVPEEMVSRASPYFSNLYGTGIALYQNLLGTPAGTAGISAGSFSANVASLASEAIVIDLGTFKTTTKTLERLNLPVRSNLQNMTQAVRKDVPELGSLAGAVEEALRQTTSPRRYEAAAQKLRDLLSDLGKQLSPENEAEGLDFDRHQGNLTQASRWRFAIYRFLPSVAYPADMQKKCEQVAKALRQCYEDLNPIAHNRDEPVIGDVGDPLIHQTALYVQELLSLRQLAHAERIRMVEMELRKTISLNLPSQYLSQGISQMSFDLPLTTVRTLDLLFSLKLSLTDSIFQGVVRVNLHGQVRVEILRNPFDAELSKTALPG